MKSKICSLLIAVAMLVAVAPAAFAADSDVILYRYSQEEIIAGTPTTMDEFNELFTREDIRSMLAVIKAQNSPATYSYPSYEVSDAEVDAVYAEVNSLLQSRAGNFYFRDMYWQMRNQCRQLNGA